MKNDDIEIQVLTALRTKGAASVEAINNVGLVLSGSIETPRLALFFAVTPKGTESACIQPAGAQGCRSSPFLLPKGQGWLIGDKAVAFKIECDVVKVMKLVNDVKMGLCNGDTGYISEVERPVRLLVHVVASTKNNLSRLGFQ